MQDPAMCEPPAQVVRLPHGQTLDSRYEAVEVVGSGAVATVYRGFSRASGRECALKVIRPEKFDAPDAAVARTLLEAETLRRLRHPNIVALHEVVLTDDECVLVLDCHPESAEASVARGRVPEDRVRRLVRQLLDAVAYLHRNGIAHRDIKPENVMIAADGRAVLVDFGLVKVLPEDTGCVATTPCGSARTMAPELVAKLRRWDLDTKRVTLSPKSVFSCDVFSVACVGYILLCQAPPFRGCTPAELQSSFERGEASLKMCSSYNQLGQHAKDFLSGCLATGTRRLAAEDAIRHPWLRGEGPEHVDVGPAPGLRDWLCGFSKLGSVQDMEQCLQSDLGPDQADDLLAVAYHQRRR
eukprot:TRINITY_DN2770_c1_g1_i8.p1 TRINITY_DN2770_c1_g1~~TRINITY_DN2770_c1_g1_i8.p1  ORF type:complete len:355 (+),score=95.49 TRINITY_DN2770_c1_g1_i8:66-1130(+)